MMLEGKVAMVTGGTRGIGFATVKTFLDNGAKVALCGSRQETVDKALAQLKAINPDYEVIGFAPDLMKQASIKEAMDAVLAKWGKLDILVNNAGITRDNILMRMSDEDFDQVIATNLRGTYLMMKAVSRIMMKQRFGRIVNMASVVGLMGNSGQVNYAASKAGVVGMTKSFAREIAARGVTVNAVAPGFIATDMTADLPEAAVSSLIASIPKGSLGSPEDVANAVKFLAADQSGYITGQVICVDGGMCMM